MIDKQVVHERMPRNLSPFMIVSACSDDISGNTLNVNSGSQSKSYTSWVTIWSIKGQYVNSSARSLRSQLPTSISRIPHARESDACLCHNHTRYKMIIKQSAMFQSRRDSIYRWFSSFELSWSHWAMSYSDSRPD